MDRRFLLILSIIVVAFASFLVFGKKTSENSAINSSVSATNHLTGEGQKHITLIEYGDYQCPACKVYFPIVEEVVSKYKKDITFQFRNFPLDNLHPNARVAARAAEAADIQGKFWEMYGLLYNNQNEWSQSPNPQSFLENYAASLKLNLDKFRRDMTSTEVNSRINADISEGQKIKAVATPTFVLGGNKIEESPQADIESFSKLIDDAIVKNN